MTLKGEDWNYRSSSCQGGARNERAARGDTL